ncbi:MAG: hypothetical protein WC901_03940 [Candidatus Margulisiibacteriota bacterium]
MSSGELVANILTNNIARQCRRLRRDVARGLRQVQLIDRKGSLDITQIPSVRALENLAWQLECPFPEIQRAIFSPPCSDVAELRLIDLSGQIVLPPTKRILSTGDLLQFSPHVPSRVPVGLFKEWRFVLSEGLQSVKAGELLTSLQMEVVRGLPGERISRISFDDELPDLQAERRGMVVTFDARGTSLNPNAKMNPIPQLAYFLKMVERELGVMIIRAFLIGSQGWGSASKSGEDIDLALVLSGEYSGDELEAIKRKHWPSTNRRIFPALALFTFSEAEWLAAQALKVGFRKRRGLDLYGEEGYRHVFPDQELSGNGQGHRLAGEIPLVIRVLSWLHDYVELVGPRRNIIKEYDQLIIILEFKARNGNIEALEELYSLDESNAELLRIVRERIRDYLNAGIPSALDGEAIRIFSLAERLVSHDFIELFNEINNALQNPQVNSDLFENAFPLLFSIVRYRGLWSQCNLRGLAHDYYASGSPDLSSEQLWQRLCSFERLMLVLGERLGEYSFALDTLETLVREGITRIGHAELFRRSSELFWDHFDSRESER